MKDPFADDNGEDFFISQLVTGEEVAQWILDTDSTRDAWWQLQDSFREFEGAMTWLCDPAWAGHAAGFLTEFSDRLDRVHGYRRLGVVQK